MKWTTVLFFWIITFTAVGQKPQTVHSFVKELKPNSFYLEQMDAWEKVIDQERTNAHAWYMLYQANRYVSIENESPGIRNERLDSIVDLMEKHVPSSFEYHVARYRQGGLNLALKDHLFKAYELGPNRVEILELMGTYYSLTGNFQKQAEFVKQWYEAGDNSPGLLNYGYNMLTGLEKDAILLTVGDNDTYPLWKMQFGARVRTDVDVVNGHMLVDDEHREHVFELLQVPKWDINPTESAETMAKFKRQLVKHLSQNKSGRPVYLTISAGKEFTESITESLYLTGLVFQYCENPIDNLAMLKNNLEYKYALDYLTVQFGPDISQGVVKRMNRNYIVPLLTLYDHYKLAGDVAGMQRIQSLALTVAEGTPEEKGVKSYFE